MSEKDTIVPTVTEMMLAINDIHSLALAARLKGGDDGSLILEIEELAESMLARSCDDGANDTEFVVEDPIIPPRLKGDVE